MFGLGMQHHPLAFYKDTRGQAREERRKGRHFFWCIYVVDHKSFVLVSPIVSSAAFDYNYEVGNSEPFPLGRITLSAA